VSLVGRVWLPVSGSERRSQTREACLSLARGRVRDIEGHQKGGEAILSEARGDCTE